MGMCLLLVSRWFVCVIVLQGVMLGCIFASYFLSFERFRRRPQRGTLTMEPKQRLWTLRGFMKLQRWQLGRKPVRSRGSVVTTSFRWCPGASSYIAIVALNILSLWQQSARYLGAVMDRARYDITCQVVSFSKVAFEWALGWPP